MPDLAIDSYDDLVTTIRAYHYNRADLATAVPVHIRLFEAKANRTLLTRQMEVRSYTDVLEAPTEPAYISLPSDFQSMRRLRLIDPDDGVTRGAPLKFRTQYQLDDIREAQSETGDPVYFTIFGDEMELYPEPSYPLRLEMVYRANLTPLSTSEQTNWLLEQAPDAYLYGALMEAAPYMREDERIAVWSAGLAAAIQQLNDLSREATYNSGPLSMGRARRGY